MPLVRKHLCTCFYGSFDIWVHIYGYTVYNTVYIYTYGSVCMYVCIYIYMYMYISVSASVSAPAYVYLFAEHGFVSFDMCSWYDVQFATGSGSSFWFMGCTNSFITDITVGFYATILVGGIPTPLQNMKVRLDHHISSSQLLGNLLNLFQTTNQCSSWGLLNQSSHHWGSPLRAPTAIGRIAGLASAATLQHIVLRWVGAMW